MSEGVITPVEDKAADGRGAVTVDTVGGEALEKLPRTVNGSDSAYAHTYHSISEYCFALSPTQPVIRSGARQRW